MRVSVCLPVCLCVMKMWKCESCVLCFDSRCVVVFLWWVDCDAVLVYWTEEVLPEASQVWLCVFELLYACFVVNVDRSVLFFLSCFSFCMRALVVCLGGRLCQFVVFGEYRLSIC